MASYGFLFLFIATSIILFSELESVSIKNVEINTGIYVWRSLFLLITSIGLIIVAGNRYWTGSDFYTYALAYKKIHHTLLKAAMFGCKIRFILMVLIFIQCF